MAWTQPDLDRLNAAIVAVTSGSQAEEVSYDGPPAQRVRYTKANLTDMLTLRKLMQQDIAATGGSSLATWYAPIFDKGYRR